MTTITDTLHGTRRELLRVLGLAGSAVATATIVAPGAALAETKHRHAGAIVYRLRARKTSRCNACARHHRRFAFLTRALADAHRAHPGCNCPITTQRIRTHAFRVLFPKGGRGVADLGKARRA